MRPLIVLIALFLLTTPIVFPRTPLPPITDVQEKAEEVTQLSKEEVSTAPTKTPPTPAPKPQNIEPVPQPIAIPLSQEPKSKKPPQSAPEGAELGALLEAKIALYTNTERSRRDLPTLQANSVLAETARKHSADMLARDFFEHENPDGCSSSCRATNANYAWRAIGENLYMLEGFEFSPEETAAMIVSGWMESPGHRANILREGYTETGVGVIVQGSAIHATVLYAAPR